MKSRTAICLHLVDVIYSHCSYHVHDCSLLRRYKLLLVYTSLYFMGRTTDIGLSPID